MARAQFWMSTRTTEQWTANSNDSRTACIDRISCQHTGNWRPLRKYSRPFVSQFRKHMESDEWREAYQRQNFSTFFRKQSEGIFCFWMAPFLSLSLPLIYSYYSLTLQFMLSTKFSYFLQFFSPFSLLFRNENCFPPGEGKWGLWRDLVVFPGNVYRVTLGYLARRCSEEWEKFIHKNMT